MPDLWNQRLVHILWELSDDTVTKERVPTHLLDVGRPPKVEVGYPPATGVSVKDRKIPVGLRPSFQWWLWWLTVLTAHHRTELSWVSGHHFSTNFHLIIITLRYLGGIWVTFYSTGPWTSGWKWIGESTRFRISHCVFRYWPELTMGDHLQVSISRFLNVFGCSDVFRVSGQLYGCHQEHTPFDVVAWHGK